MSLKALAFSFVGLVVLFPVGCGAPQMRLNIKSEPSGARVYISRRGERAYRGVLGPVRGDMKSDKIVEDFVLLGTSPVEYSSDLEEHESGVSVFGVGAKVVRQFGDGVIRIEKDGFETVERTVHFKDGEVDLDLRLEPESIDNRNGADEKDAAERDADQLFE